MSGIPSIPKINLFLSSSGIGRSSGGGGGVYDTDVQTWITGVEAAEGQTLEASVKTAVNDFVVGLKADGEWDKLHTICLFGGVRSITGASVPLKGTTPTSYNFVDADLSRSLGIKGDYDLLPANAKFFNHNVKMTSFPEDNCQMWTYMTERPNQGSELRSIMGLTNCQFRHSTTTNWNLTMFGRSSSSYSFTNGTSVGLIGFSRSSTTEVTFRAAQTSSLQAKTSVALSTYDIFSFAYNFNGDTTPEGNSSPRLLMVGIGNAAGDLANTESRLDTLKAALVAAGI